MEQNKKDIFISSMSGKFPSSKMLIVDKELDRIDDSKFVLLQSLDYKDPVLILVLSIVVGSLGIDRFLLGQTGLGVLKLLTCGGFGIWWIVDLFLVMDMAKEQNFNTFYENVNRF